MKCNMIPVFFYSPKKAAKCQKKKDTARKFLSPNRFLNLDFHDDMMIIRTNSHNNDRANSYIKEKSTIKRQNLINMTNGN